MSIDSRGQTVLTRRRPFALRIGPRTEIIARLALLLGLGSARGRPASIARVAQVLRHVSHCFRCSSKFATTLVPPGFDVASCGVIEIAGRIEIELCVGSRSEFACSRNAFVCTVEVAIRSVVDVSRPLVIGRRRKVRILAVESSGVTCMIDGAGEIMSGGSKLAGTMRLAL